MKPHNKLINELITKPNKYCYNIDDDNWVKITEKDFPDNVLYLDRAIDFVSYILVSYISVRKELKNKNG